MLGLAILAQAPITLLLGSYLAVWVLIKNPRMHPRTGWLVAAAVIGIEFLAITDRLPWPHDLIADRGSVLFLPVGQLSWWRAACGAALMVGLGALVLPALASPTTRRIVVLGMAWSLVSRLEATTGELLYVETLRGSQTVLGSTVAYAVILAVLACSNVQRLLPIVVVVASLACLNAARTGEFLGAYGQMESLRTSLEDVAESATPDRPLVALSIPQSSSAVPFIQPGELFPLAEIPQFDRDVPCVGMGWVWENQPGSEALLFDVGPLRALGSQGAHLLSWPVEGPEWQVDRLETNGSLPQLTQERPGWFLAAQPVDPLSIEAIEVEVSGECSGGEISWLRHTGGGPQSCG